MRKSPEAMTELDVLRMQLNRERGGGLSFRASVAVIRVRVMQWQLNRVLKCSVQASSRHPQP